METDGMGGTYLREWPDGKPLMEQPQVMVDMFDLIEHEFRKHIASNKEK